MENFKEIKTTVIGFLLWVIAILYKVLPYFSEKELWQPNGTWLAALFVGGLLLMLAPDRFVEFLFGWLNKKSK